MIIFPPVRWSLDRALRWGIVLAATLCAVCFVLVGALFFADPQQSVSDLTEEQESSPSGGKSALSYEMIGSGALALRPSHALGWVARLADELALIAYNSRPDMNAKETQILFGLKNGREQLSVFNGKYFYLKESEEGKGLLASEDPTALRVKPILLDGGSVLLEVSRKLVSKEGQEGEEKGQFIANLQAVGSKQNILSRDFAVELKAASFFPQDVLMQRYGGKEYVHLNQKGVLDITTQWGVYGLFVSPGDYLIYEGKEWRVAGFEELKKEAPIAQVREISERGLEIDVWDEKGFFPAKFKIEMKKQVHPPFGPESMPTSIRLRTGTQVSCAFGKRRLILKQGDWLLRTASGWRNLRSTEDVRLYLERRLKGDLFIFDAIERDALGKCLMKGNFFDDTRTYIQPVNLPINVDKQQNKSSKRRSVVTNGNRGVK